MGVITADNIWYLIGGKPHKPRHGYISSFSVRGGAKAFKEYVLEQDGYINRDGKPAKNDEEIIRNYRGLWEIEETFRITKGELEARPVYVSRKDRIDAHFLTCFIALTIIRILQKKTERQFTTKKIIDTLNRISCS